MTTSKFDPRPWAPAPIRNVRPDPLRVSNERSITLERHARRLFREEKLDTLEIAKRLFMREHEVLPLLRRSDPETLESCA